MTTDYKDSAEKFERIRELIRRIRGTRSEHNVPAAKRVPATVSAGNQAKFVESQRQIITFLARLDDSSLVIDDEIGIPEESVTIALGDITVYLPLAGLVDIDQEKSRLTSELEKVDQQLSRVSGLLKGEFALKAPKEVVERERQKLAQLKSSRVELTTRLNNLG